MASDALESVRRKLSSSLEKDGGVWGQEKANNLREELIGDFPEELANKISDCMDSGQGFEACAADVLGNKYVDGSVAQEIASQWSDDPQMKMAVSDAASGSWSPEARQEIAKIAKDNNLDHLNALCMKNSLWPDVKDAANLDATPTSSRECLTKVAEATGLSGELSSAWE